MTVSSIPNSDFDAHVHLQAYPEAQLRMVLKRARNAGVNRFGCCGTRPKDWADVLAIATAEAGVEPACGLHPWYSAGPDLPQNWLEWLDRLLEQYPDLGVGEIGLDALRPEREVQMHAFTAQLDLAVKHGRSVAIHAVRAHNELLSALRPRANHLPNILLHGISCSLEVWREYEKLGANISIGPSVLDPRAKKVRELARHVPADRLFFETDAPSTGRVNPALPINGPENLPTIIACVQSLRLPLAPNP